MNDTIRNDNKLQDTPNALSVLRFLPSWLKWRKNIPNCFLTDAGFRIRVGILVKCGGNKLHSTSLVILQFFVQSSTSTRYSTMHP